MAVGVDRASQPADARIVIRIGAGVALGGTMGGYLSGSRLDREVLEIGIRK